MFAEGNDIAQISFPYVCRLFINISSVVEFQRWWVIKSKLFGQESTYSKVKFSKKSVDELRFVKRCQN
jgi:hypothetical protein